MDRWVGRVAVVTGSSVGIGAAICEMLVRNGLKVIGAARGVEQTQALAEKLGGEKGSLTAIKCDVTNDSDVYSLFETVKQLHGGVDICVNNAGISINKSLLDGTPEDWRRIMDVNVVALCLFTKLSVQSMRERGVDDGHIINISSIAGHKIYPEGSSHFYSGTKFAVRAITEGLRQELREAKAHIRVSAVSPGLVKTEFIARVLEDEQISEKIFQSAAHLTSNDIADIVQHILSAPPHVEINDVTVLPCEEELNKLPE